MTNTKPVILIADDETNIRLMLRTALESSGYEVIEAVEQDAPLSPCHSGDGDVLALVRREIWHQHDHRAEVLLEQTAERAHRDPTYFNLLGVLHEAEGRPRLAKRFHVEAIRANGGYEPAASNLHRLEELEAYGHTTRRVALGDEASVLESFLGRLAVRELEELRHQCRE